MSIRSLPRAQLVAWLKDTGTTQRVIGRRAKVTQSYVGRVIAGREPLRPSKGSERVWREIEKALNGRAGARS